MFIRVCWTPILGKQLKCMKDDRGEAKDHYENAIGVYKINAETEDLLVSHIQREISKLITASLKLTSIILLLPQLPGNEKERWAWLYQQDLNAWQRKNLLQRYCTRYW